MAELRRDPIVGRWTIVNVEEPRLPADFEVEPRIIRGGANCPFCYGNEAMTPPEIEAIRNDSTKPNTSGWSVRVVPNKFPALRIEGDLNRRGIGMFDMSNGIGAHEVIVETPYHDKTVSDLLNEEIEQVITLYLRRCLDLRKDRRFKYLLIFKNHGSAAGASLEHTHTQLIALPLIPKNVSEEINGALEYFEYRGRCIFCDMIGQETQEKERIIAENKNYLAFCPFVSRFPFEAWITPKKHEADFCFCGAQKDGVVDLAGILKETLLPLKLTLNDPAYNFIIHTSPTDFDANIKDGYHWHLEIMPKLMRVAGFEWGTGFYIVPTPPEVAAKYLREATTYGTK